MQVFRITLVHYTTKYILFRADSEVWSTVPSHKNLTSSFGARVCLDKWSIRSATSLTDSVE